MPEGRLAQAFEEALREALQRPGLTLVGHEDLGGGCISSAARLRTAAGDFFAKWNHAAPADLFLREADGLAELARSGASLVVPRVLAARAPAGGLPGFILLEHLEPGPRDDERLGRGLAELHRHAAPRFGFAGDSYCGSTRQANAWCESWPEFYAERRLRPLLAAIAERRGLARDERRVHDGLLARLPGLLGAGHQPSLIHGDLWSGNVLHTQRGPALVDPACAFAEREMELGMSTLFGGLSARAQAAYEEAWPLPAGWRERNPLYQLYHLLNHQLLFGGGYGAQALATARRFV